MPGSVNIRFRVEQSKDWVGLWRSFVLRMNERDFSATLLLAAELMMLGNYFKIIGSSLLLKSNAAGK